MLLLHFRFFWVHIDLPARRLPKQRPIFRSLIASAIAPKARTNRRPPGRPAFLCVASFHRSAHLRSVRDSSSLSRFDPPPQTPPSGHRFPKLRAFQVAPGRTTFQPPDTYTSSQAARPNPAPPPWPAIDPLALCRNPSLSFP